MPYYEYDTCDCPECIGKSRSASTTSLRRSVESVGRLSGAGIGENNFEASEITSDGGETRRRSSASRRLSYDQGGLARQGAPAPYVPLNLEDEPLRDFITVMTNVVSAVTILSVCSLYFWFTVIVRSFYFFKKLRESDDKQLKLAVLAIALLFLVILFCTWIQLKLKHVDPCCKEQLQEANKKSHGTCKAAEAEEEPKMISSSQCDQSSKPSKSSESRGCCGQSNSQRTKSGEKRDAISPCEAAKSSKCNHCNTTPCMTDSDKARVERAKAERAKAERAKAERAMTLCPNMNNKICPKSTLNSKTTQNKAQNTKPNCISDDEGREILTKARRYAIPTEMKQPPSILLYLRDIFIGEH